MDVVNRGLLLVTPRQPYLDWANGLEERGPDFRLEEGMPAAYLVPRFGTLEEVDSFVEEAHARIFEEELAAWTDDREAWPGSRDLETFYRWFGLEYTDLVADLGDGPLATERV